MFSLTCTWLRISLPNVLLQLKCVNSVGSWEDFSQAVTWSGGGVEEDGWNHFFKADLNLIIDFNFPASLSGEPLTLLVWRTRGGAELRSGLKDFWGGFRGRWGQILILCPGFEVASLIHPDSRPQARAAVRLESSEQSLLTRALSKRGKQRGIGWRGIKEVNRLNT